MATVTLSGSGTWTVPEGVTSLTKVVIVAGAGGGGASGNSDDWPGGGGGGGGVIVLENYAVTPGAALAYSVGAGGLGATIRTAAGATGSDSVFNGVTALGGGGGGSAGSIVPFQGGSGGGGVRSSGGAEGLQPTSADGGFGNDGGGGTQNAPSYGGGGGGGAGSAGVSATGALAGNGGGAHTVDGSDYGAGGGGGTYDTANEGLGGANAGNGGRSGSEAGQSGTNTFGGGGGGAGASSVAGGSGGNGGSGTIILTGEGIGDPEFVDWSESIDPNTSQVYYACEIDDGTLDAIRPPISSWQATVQSGRASYTQAVIPAATQWVAPISDRADGEFIIYRGVRFPDGTTQESEMARAPLGDVRFDVGPTNATMTISGYSTEPPPAQALTRTLHNVRSESTANGLHRVRCDIDFFLRPGHTVIARGTTFEAAYINYYVTGGDEYMDVGERA